MKIISKINVLILFIAIIFFGNTVYGASEKSLLLALNLECSADKKGKKPYRDNFFGFATEHSFHASRWWNGSGDRLGEIGQTTFNATRTNKSLVINGEGSWIDNKSKKSWKLQFVSKGDKSIIEHLENGIEGFEGSGQGRRECVIKLLNQVEASDAIQIGSYTKVISALRNQIDNFKERNDNLENLNNDYTQRIESLDTLITTLKKEKNTNLDKIASLNSELEKNKKNNSEFEIKYEELTKQIKDFTNKLEISTKENINLEKEITLLKETENTLSNSIVDINKEIDSLTDINLSLMDKIDLYEKKEKELTQIIEENENQRQEEERLINEKKQQEEELAEERRLAEEKKLKEKEELEKLAQEELNQKLALLTEETDLEKAQNFLLNLERFIKENPSEFDIIIISEYFIATRSILDGDLNSTNKAKLSEFKDYVSQNSELYLNFSNEISKTTLNEKLNKINEAILSLENSINELKLIMVNNQQSANLQKWTDIIKLAEISLQELKSIEDLINSKKNIDDLIMFKKQADKAIVDLNKTKDELKIYLQENLTTELAPLILDQIKVIEDSIVTENVEKITKTNEETKQFINKKIIEPEEKKKAEEIEKEKKVLLEEQNKKFEEIFEKYNAKNDYQKQIVKLLNFFQISFERIEFSKRDNVIKIYNITDDSNTFNLDELRITKLNKKYLESWFEINEKYDYLIDLSDFNELPKLEYLGEIAESVNFYGLIDYSILRGDTTFEEIGINGLDFSSFDKLKAAINSSLINENDKDLLSLILSSKFDKFYIKNYVKSEYDPVSLKYFEIADWNEFSFENIELQDLKIEAESNKLHLEKFTVSNFSLDNNFIQDLLGSEETQQLLLRGDYSEIFNSFVSLDNLEINKFKANIDNQDVFILDNAKINDIKFDYFGANNDIKVPTSFNFEINGADFNYEEFRDISGGLGFLDGLIDDLDYEKIKFDFKSGWEWDTKRNNILFDLDLGITDAASLAISSNFIDLDTKILNIQGGPLLTYLMTSPKLKELSVSLNDSSLKDKLLDYVANEQNMTTRQLKDFIIQSMDIYSNTLGIDQSLAKDFIKALSNFIEKSNKIILSIKPLDPVSVNDLTPDLIGQNYNGLINKLNIGIGN